MINLTLNTWIISDTHFFHVNVGNYCNRPNAWHDLIIQNWKNCIKPDEDVFHLGDLMLGPKAAFNQLIPTLPGNLYLIRGNHDRFSKSYYAERNITLVEEPCYWIRPASEWQDPECYIIFSHRPIMPLPQLASRTINVHGHVHNNTPPISPNHINVSVEVTDYMPRRLGNILNC